jgi:hypothetical protein
MMPSRTGRVPTLDAIRTLSAANIRVRGAGITQSIKRTCNIRLLARHHPILVTSLAFSAGVLAVMAVRSLSSKSADSSPPVTEAPVAPSPADNSTPKTNVSHWIFSWLFDEGLHLSLLSMISGFLKTNHPEAQDPPAQA